MTDKQAQSMRNYLNTAVISGVKLLHLTTDELSGLLDELEAVEKTSAARLEALDRTHKMFQRERDRGDAADKYAKDRDAENEELMLTVGRLRVEKEAAEKRIAELTGKPAEDYPDDFELRNAANFLDDEGDIQTSLWLKELRRRRTAGICIKVG